jgi:hypothetical protein
MAINSIDDIANGLSNAQKFNFIKVPIANLKTIGAYGSLWLASGMPSAGQGPPIWNSAGSGVFTCTGSGTLGTIILNPPVINQYLAKLSGTANIAGTLIIADRLWACGALGFSANGSTIPNPWDLPARITDSGCGCELWMEVYTTAMGAASGSLTAIYTNPEGTGSRIGRIQTLVSAPAAAQMQPVSLQSGDYGIKQLNKVALSATSTSGSFGMTILKRIAEIPIPLSGAGNLLDWASLGLPVISPSACIMFLWQGVATTAAVVVGSFSVIDK